MMKESHRTTGAVMLSRCAFSLVELLVVIVITTILVALLIPAVQGARSAARRLQCANHQKQTALGILQYANQSNRLPSVRHPRLRMEDGSSKVTWRYEVLPFIEEQSMYDTLADGRWRLIRKASHSASAANKVADVAIFHCPSEPGAPHIERRLRLIRGRNVLFDAVGYEANFAPHTVWKPTSGANGASHMLESASEGAWYGNAHWTNDPLLIDFVLYKQAKLAFITDGLSQTILLHEQEIPMPGPASLGSYWSLDESFVHWVSGESSLVSHHRAGAHVAMGDGAVRYLSSDIGLPALQALLGRQDGAVADLSR